MNVKLDMDEIDLTAADSKATYEEKMQIMLLSLRTLGIKPDVRRLFVYRKIFHRYNKHDI